MRDLTIIKDKRNELRDSLALCHNRRKSSTDNNLKGFNDMGEWDKEAYIYLVKVMEKLTTQINVLEFVLNEDTNIADALSYYSRGMNILGINRESVFKEEKNENSDKRNST
jgi:hypothetical protein